MGQLSTDSVITLVVGLAIGVPQLLFTIFTWWEAKRSNPQIVDPEKHTLDDLLVLLCYNPTTTQPDIVHLANSSRVFTLNQLDIDHAQSNQANTIKKLLTMPEPEFALLKPSAQLAPSS
ncbi:hypothetical protein N431DRAFT_459787 [Stipitochalara longipes BDJ]|nr:hypothetical protein N431DRAFT_459787 [Stipitochalara longipes BDJ]